MVTSFDEKLDCLVQSVTLIPTSLKQLCEAADMVGFKRGISFRRSEINCNKYKQLYGKCSNLRKD